MVKGHILAIFMFLIMTGMALTTLTFAKEEGTTLKDVQLSLFIECGCRGGAPLADVRVIGQDGSETPFDAITDANGYASIEGSPGNWQFTASKIGFVPSSWTMSVTERDTEYRALFNDNTAWKDKVDSTGKLSNEELASLVIANFPEGDVPSNPGESIRATAYAVAKAESERGNPTAWGDRFLLGDSLGLWQINLCYHPEYKGHEADLFKPEYNAKAAFDISNGGTQWTPWSTWINGAYRRYLEEGQEELSQYQALNQ